MTLGAHVSPPRGERAHFIGGRGGFAPAARPEATAKSQRARGSRAWIYGVGLLLLLLLPGSGRAAPHRAQAAAAPSPSSSPSHGGSGRSLCCAGAAPDRQAGLAAVVAELPPLLFLNFLVFLSFFLKSRPFLLFFLSQLYFPPRYSFCFATPYHHISSFFFITTTQCPPPFYKPPLVRAASDSPLCFSLTQLLSRKANCYSHPRRAQGLLRQRAYLPLVAQLHRRHWRSCHRSAQLWRPNWPHLGWPLHPGRHDHHVLRSRHIPLACCCH